MLSLFAAAAPLKIAAPLHHAMALADHGRPSPAAQLTGARISPVKGE